MLINNATVKNNAPQKHLEVKGLSCTDTEQVLHLPNKTNTQLYQA